MTARARQDVRALAAGKTELEVVQRARAHSTTSEQLPVNAGDARTLDNCALFGIVDLATGHAERRAAVGGWRRESGLEARIETAVLEGSIAAQAIFSNGFIAVSHAARLLGPFIT